MMSDKQVIEETRHRSRRDAKWYISKLRYLADSLRQLDGPVLGAIAKTAQKLLDGLADKITAGWLANDIDREDAE